MDFNTFLSLLSKIEHKPLGGMSSQFKMAPHLRLKLDDDHIRTRNPRESAVMALFYPNHYNETHFLLIERPSYDGTHSGQISFVGGKQDPNDKDLADTALRETYEETGIDKKTINLVKEFSKTYIPPSNFWVTPFMGYVDFTPKFVANHEVEQFIEVNLKDLLDDCSCTSKILSTSYMKDVKVPCFVLNNHTVWGATAMILSEIKDFLK